MIGPGSNLGIEEVALRSLLTVFGELDGKTILQSSPESLAIRAAKNIDAMEEPKALLASEPTGEEWYKLDIRKGVAIIPLKGIMLSEAGEWTADYKYMTGVNITINLIKAHEPDRLGTCPRSQYQQP